MSVGSDSQPWAASSQHGPSPHETGGASSPRVLRLPARKLTLFGAALLLSIEAALGFAANDPSMLVLYLVGLAGLALAAVTLVKPETAVLALLFLLFTRLSDVYGPRGGLITVNQVLMALFLVSMLLRRQHTESEGLISDRVFGWMLGFGAALALSAWAAPDRSATIAELIAYLREVLILFVLVNLIATLGGMRAAVWTLVLAGLMLSSAAVLYAATGYDLGGLAKAATHNIALGTFGSRLTGPVGDPNDFARLLVTVAPLALYRVWDERSVPLRLLAAVALGLTCLVIVLTFSRGGIIALVAVVVLAVVMQRVQPSHLLAAGVVLAVAAFGAPQSYWDRLNVTAHFFSPETSYASSHDSSLSERTFLLQVGLLIFQDHPIFGVGKGNYDLYYPRYAFRVSPGLSVKALQAHSTPVQIAAETGLVGLAMLAAIVIVSVGGVRGAKRRFASAGQRSGFMLAESIEIAIYGYVIDSLFLSDSYPRYLWLLIGLAVIARQVSLRSVPNAAPARAAALVTRTA